MKKTLKYIIVFLISVFVFFRIGKMTGLLTNFRISSTSNEPNIKVGSLVFGTNLITPKKMDFVLFSQENKEFESGIWTHRLCGVESDTIEIINGILYVNNKNIDKHLNIKRSYLISSQELRILKKNRDIDENSYFKNNRDSVIVFLSENLVRKSYKFRRHNTKKPDKMITEVYNKPWNADNFGPLIVPEHFVFVLGDNRNNSLDSRYIGLIKKEDLKGILIFK